MTKLASSRGRTSRFVLAASAGCLILAAMILPLPLPVTAAQSRTIQVQARAFAFEPGSVSVQKGDTVTVHLEALDTVHGLYLDGYDLRLVAEPGKSATATFVATSEGKFSFRCAVACGALHPFMIGELNVTPNMPFARAVLVILIAVTGAIIFFWK